MMPITSSAFLPADSMAFQLALTGPATHLTAAAESNSPAILSNISANPMDVAMSCLAILCSMPYWEDILSAIFWGLSFILIESASSLMW